MKSEKIENEEKTQVIKDQMNTTCCGGMPVINSDSCCKLDEDKKSESLNGCGCNTNPTVQTSKRCC